MEVTVRRAVFCFVTFAALHDPRAPAESRFVPYLSDSPQVVAGATRPRWPRPGASFQRQAGSDIRCRPRLCRGPARPPDDRSDDGLTADLREQLEEGAEEARRFAAALEHQRAARQLVSAYHAGRTACPEGYAVVAAAVDWAHAGIGRARPHRPISQPALRTLFGRHLEQLRSGQPVTEADWEHGLAWALAERVPREPLFGIDRQLLEPDGPAGLALLTRCRWSGQEGFDPSAALVDHARDTGYQLASATWRFIIEQLRPDEALEVGQAAFEQGNAEVARAAWTIVV